MPAKRIQQIAKANATLLAFFDTWDRYRHDPEVSDLAIGNPQEVAIDGFASALIDVATPLDKDHHAYKGSEDEPRRTRLDPNR